MRVDLRNNLQAKMRRSANRYSHCATLHKETAARCFRLRAEYRNRQCHGAIGPS
jgi:hypothetical protein